MAANSITYEKIFEIEYAIKHTLFIGQEFKSYIELLKYIGLEDVTSANVRKRWRDYISQLVVIEPLYKNSYGFKVVDIHMDKHIFFNNNTVRKGRYNFPCGIMLASFFLEQLNKNEVFDGYFFSSGILLKCGLANVRYRFDSQYLKNMYTTINSDKDFVRMKYSFGQLKYVLSIIHNLQHTVLSSGLDYLHNSNIIQYKRGLMKYDINGIDHLSEKELKQYYKILKNEEDKIIKERKVEQILSLYDKLEIQNNTNAIIFKMDKYRVFKVNHVKTKAENLHSFMDSDDVKIEQTNEKNINDIFNERLEEIISKNKNNQALFSLAKKILDISNFANEEWYQQRNAPYSDAWFIDAKKSL